MKWAPAALMVASASRAWAQPHHHAHRHLHQHQHQHEQRDVTYTSWAPGPTAYVYMLDGEEISPEEVCEGIQDNELKFVDGNDPGVCSTSSTSPPDAWAWSSNTAPAAAATTTTTTTTTTPSPATSTTPSAAGFYQASSWAGNDAWSSPSAAPTWGAGPPAQSSQPSQGSWPSSGPSHPSGGSGVGGAFPDGQLDCSTFPSQYGAIALDYLGMGGWAGLQAVTISGGAVTNIVTGVSGDSCTEGMMCSYACPPGYQKSQWPSTQGATGQSVGGLSCSGGKLHLTNAGLSSSLCIPGAGGVQATNSAGGVVAICRTDYPGTESETIPVELQPGQTEALAVPDAATYYEWQGKSTSAQYYLNPIGYPASQACQWGSAGSPLGNFAPINFGVGAKGGVTWLSIFQNAPTTNAQYQGTVELTGNLSGTCKYQNGQYCGATGCNSQGCTVSVISGTATYVISS